MQGRVYELDGLKAGPIDVGHADDSSQWLATAYTAIQERISRCSAAGISYSLLTVGVRRRVLLERELESVLQQQQIDADNHEHATRVSQLHAEIAAEVNKERLQSLENARRKHNYLPFILALCNAMADRGQLPSGASAMTMMSQQR